MTEMRALSVRQPWAELILLGHKTIEVRSWRTNIRERIYIYAGQKLIDAEEKDRVANRYRLNVDGLPRGVLVGTVKIVDCRPLEMSDSGAACFEIDQADGYFAWLLERPEKADDLRKPKNHPQPGFFNPF